MNYIIFFIFLQKKDTLKASLISRSLGSSLIFLLLHYLVHNLYLEHAKVCQCCNHTHTIGKRDGGKLQEFWGKPVPYCIYKCSTDKGACANANGHQEIEFCYLFHFF